MSSVTVIVPIYDVEKYVAKCLDSLIKQTFDGFEVWAVSDGSPDNSSSIVKKFIEKDSRVKLIEKKNGGYGSVLEYCIRNIKTKYFIVCDPDDWLAPNAIEILYKNAEKNNLDIAIGDRYDVFKNDYKPKLNRAKPADLTELRPFIVYKDRVSVQKFAFFLPSPHAKIFRTAIVRNVVFPHHVGYTDFLLYLSAVGNANSIMYINKPLAYYLLDRPGNTATDQRPKIIKEHMIVWRYTLKNILRLSKENGILLFDLYLGIIQMLGEYARLTSHTFNDEYWKMIIDNLNEICNLKKNIKKVPDRCTYIENKIADKILKSNNPEKDAKKYVILIVMKHKIKKVLGK